MSFTLVKRGPQFSNGTLNSVRPVNIPDMFSTFDTSHFIKPFKFSRSRSSLSSLLNKLLISFTLDTFQFPIICNGSSNLVLFFKYILTK